MPVFEYVAIEYVFDSDGDVLCEDNYTGDRKIKEIVDGPTLVIASTHEKAKQKAVLELHDCYDVDTMEILVRPFV